MKDEEDVVIVVISLDIRAGSRGVEERSNNGSELHDFVIEVVVVVL